MSVQILNLMVTADHAVPVEPGSGLATVTVDQTGGTVYYADNPQVSSTSNQGSVAPGGTANFSAPAWLIASSPAGVKIQITPDGTAVTGPDGTIGSFGGTAVKSSVAAFFPHASNPLWPKTTFPNAVATFGTFGDFWFDGATLHTYMMVDGATSPGIYHGTSATGLPGSWTFDATPCIAPTPAAWDSGTVGVPCVFKDPGSNTLHMYYRGVGAVGPQIGHATTSTTTPGGPWTKDAGNPLVTGSSFPGTGTPYLHNVEAGPGRIILVGSTYYMWVSVVNVTAIIPERQCTIVTATSPSGPWTLLAGTYGTSQSIFRNGRFCNSVWTDGGLFYSLCPHMTQRGSDGLQTGSELELWVASGPTFQPGDARCLGTVREPTALHPAWEAQQMDTPTVPTDDITRSTFNCTGGRPQIYYAAEDASGSWLMGLMLPPSQIYLPATPPRPVTILGPWNTSTVTASQAAVNVPVYGGTLNWIAVPFSCSVVGINLNMGSTGHLTAGTVTATLTRAGTSTAFARTLSCSLNTAAQAFASARAQWGEMPFNPGDLIGVQVTTDASFATTATQIDFTVAVEPR